MPKKDFETTITDFVHRIAYDQAQITELLAAVETVWMQRNQSGVDEEQRIDTHIAGLQAKAKALVDKIKLVSSELIIKSIEEDIMQQNQKLRSCKRSATFAVPKNRSISRSLNNT